jgi:hypothetical protein
MAGRGVQICDARWNLICVRTVQQCHSGWRECALNPRKPIQTKMSLGTGVALHHREPVPTDRSVSRGVCDHELGRGRYGWGSRFEVGGKQICDRRAAANSHSHEAEAVDVDGGDVSVPGRSRNGGEVFDSGVSAPRPLKSLPREVSKVSRGSRYPPCFWSACESRSGRPESFPTSFYIDPVLA